MVNQILVPLDGSPLAEQAIPCAVLLGQGLSAELVLSVSFRLHPMYRQSSTKLVRRQMLW